MRWLVLTTMVFFAATCGQKGPLTRPEPKVSSDIELLLAAQQACALFERYCPISNQRSQQH